MSELLPPPKPRRQGDAPTSHSSLEPQGEAIAWSALGSLLSGPIVWGGIGILADRWLGTGRVFTAIGLVVGFFAGFLIVYLRFGRAAAAPAQTRDADNPPDPPGKPNPRGPSC
jgi:ATP synthase protein I